MQKLIASNDYYYPTCYCPCIVNDDGSAVEDDKSLFPTISFFTQPDHGYGEKSVYHATVRDSHVYRDSATSKAYPFSLSYEDRYGWIPTQFRETCSLNTCIDVWWRGDKDDEPTNCEWFIKYKYTKPSVWHNYVTFTDREWWCSAAYAREYGWTNGKTHGVDHSTSQMYVELRGQDLFRQYILTRSQAQKVLQSVLPQHAVPAGLVSELYRTAMNSITCNTNTIANILEIVDMIKEIKSGNFGALLSDLPKYLKSKQTKKVASSSWLGYRYAYNTTKSDIEEYKEKLLPLFNQKSGRHIVRSGMTVKEGTAHCKVVYTDRALNSVQQLYVMLKRMGLCLDAYSVWDMIPLSFVVDWFLPIGDFLEDFSQNWVADSAIFDIATVTTSWKWSHTIQDTAGCYDISYYSRSVTTEPPEFESYSEDPSTKTTLKRVVDAAALIIG